VSSEDLLQEKFDWAALRSVLETPSGGYPHEAMRAARAAREEVTPHLIEVLEQLAADPTPALDGATLHLHAICLLAGFREARAYRPMAALAHQPDEIEDELFGDFSGEVLGRALASVCPGDLEPIHRLAEDVTISPWLRTAALTALTTRVLEGDAEAAETARYLERLGEGEAARLRAQPEEDRDRIFLSSIVGSLCDIGPTPVLESIRAWFGEGLVDEWHVRLPYVEESAKKPFSKLQERVRGFGRGYVRDAIGEMQDWACFKDDAEEEVGGPAPWELPAIPYVRPEPKIGRNEPCSCGSGKKYKKCCGSGH
jgi:hypothetical protein